MDTIDKHRNKLARQFVPRKEALEIVASAKSLVEIALRSTHLLTRHRRKLMSEALWWISEADGKYSTRYRTKDVYDLANSRDGGTTKIQHEHVYPRKEVIKELLSNSERYLANPAELERVLNDTVGCVVTASQHHSLRKGARGWLRYEGVVVYDMSTIPPSVRSEAKSSSETNCTGAG